MQTEIVANILKIGRSFVAYRRERLKDLELLPAQHLLISRICRHPGSTQEQLADALCMDKTTVAHQLCKLEEMGYIERRVSAEDGRCRRVYPADKALGCFPAIHGAYESFTARLLEGVGEEEKAELVRLTGLLWENARQIARDGKKGG